MPVRRTLCPPHWRSTLQQPAAYTGDEPFVFVCYAHADRDIVYAQMSNLHEHGVNVWYDEGISAGKVWRAAIGDALMKASHVVFYVSKNSLQSEHCNREVNLALDEGKEILPVYLEDVELTSDLKVGLSRVQALFLTDANYQQHLLRAIGQLGARSSDNETNSTGTHRWQIALALAGVAIIVGVIAGYLNSTPSSTADQHVQSIAVLPFADISPTHDQQHFGDGVATELLGKLTHLEGLRVASRTSSFSFANSDADLPTIGETLGVEWVLEGTVSKEADTIRITTHLVEVATGYHTWSETYDRQLISIFSTQNEIATAVAGALGVRLKVGGINAFRGSGTQNIEAYEAYLQTLQIAVLNDRNKRLRLLARAVELDPNYAAAWAVYGVTIGSSMWTESPEKAPKILARAHSLVQKAVDLNPLSAEVNSMLATLLYPLGRWQEAEEIHLHAIDLYPNGLTYENYANMLMRAGRLQSAEKYFATGKSIDPNMRSSLFGLRHVRIAQNRIDDAYQLISADLSEQAWAKLEITLNESNLESLRERISDLPTNNIATHTLFLPVLEVIGSSLQAVSVLRQVYADESIQWPEKYHHVSLLAAYFGEPEFALEAKAREARNTPVRLGAVWFPVMSKVRQLAGFRQLMTDINLEEYWRTYGWADQCSPINDIEFSCQ
jgi:TolB-like protein/Tfp pilus assembly protein PilF